MKRKKTKKTPEEIARSEDLTRRLEKRIAEGKAAAARRVSQQEQAS